MPGRNSDTNSSRTILRIAKKKKKKIPAQVFKAGASRPLLRAQWSLQMPVNYSHFPLRKFLFVLKSAQEGKEGQSQPFAYFFFLKGKEQKRKQKEKRITPKWKKKTQLYSTCSPLYTPPKRACQLKTDFLPPKEIFGAICC